MPSRIIRDGILRSEPVNSLSPEAELFYRRLMSVVDDYGRYYGSPKQLRSACYPVQIDSVSESDVEKWVMACAWTEPALIGLYEKAGKSYIVLYNLGKARSERSKFPEPPETLDRPNPQNTCAAGAAPVSDVPYSYSSSYSSSLTEAPVASLPEKVTPSAADGRTKVDDQPSPAFLTFWDRYPHHRRVDRAECWSKWKSRELDKNPVVLPGLELWLDSRDWTKDDGEFIPNSTTWLNQSRWETAPKSTTPSFDPENIHAGRPPISDEALAEIEGVA